MLEINKKECTGCGACYNSCPVDAISMVQDEKGFYKPEINEEKCIKCGKCLKACPLDNYVSNNDQPKVYAFINKDDAVRIKSASGGAFPFFAKEIIKRDGVVFGVVWDSEIKAGHAQAQTLEGLEKMYSSKYVQANTKNTFNEAKYFLEAGRLVLFSGTPCQIAGLKSYLNKDYENLITIDLICHGVPSPLVFEKYKKEFMEQKKDSGRILNINFRSKISSWSASLTTTTTTTTYNILATEDQHMSSFLSNLCLNDSCLKCQFNKIPRVADITIGDFWGVDDFDKSLNDKKGISILLFNSDKGLNLFEELKANCIYRAVPLEFAIKHNPNLVNSSKPNKNMDKFFELLKNKTLTLEQINNKCIKRYPKILVWIFKLQPRFIKTIVKKALGI